MNRGS